MKRTIFILICSIALFTTTSRICLAQSDKGKFGIGIKISYLNYLDDWSTTNLKLESNDDIALGANITYNFTKIYSLELSLDHTIVDLNSNIQGFDIQIPPSNVGELKQTPFLLTGRINIYSNNRTNLYLGAGLGYYFHSFDPSMPITTHNFESPFMDVYDYDVEDSIGYHIGGGMEIYLSDKFSFNIDIKHIWIKADIEGTILFEIDPDTPWVDLAIVIMDEDDTEIDLDTFSIGVGFKYYF